MRTEQEIKDSIANINQLIINEEAAEKVYEAQGDQKGAEATHIVRRSLYQRKWAFEWVLNQ